MSYETFFGGFAVICAATVVLAAVWSTAPSAWRWLLTWNQRAFYVAVRKRCERAIGKLLIDHTGSIDEAFRAVYDMQRRDAQTDDLIRRGMQEIQDLGERVISSGASLFQAGLASRDFLGDGQDYEYDPGTQRITTRKPH